MERYSFIDSHAARPFTANSPPMKIQYALMSRNSAMSHLGYWPVVARAWRRLCITPVLFYIRDSDVAPPPADGIVHTIAPLPEVDIAVQYTWARFWGAQLYADATVAISDIDILPLSADYFVDQLRDIPDHRYVHLGGMFYLSNAEAARLMAQTEVATADIKRFCAWWHVARGRLLKEVLALPDDWAQAAREVAPHYVAADGFRRRYARVWHGDELYPTRQIHAYPKQSIFTVLLAGKTHPTPAQPGTWSTMLRDRDIHTRPGARAHPFVYDPALLQQPDYYLFAHCPLPCSPTAVAMADVLLRRDCVSRKVRRVLEFERAYLNRRGHPLAKILFAWRLILLACLAKNHSMMDAACARLIKDVVLEKMSQTARNMLRLSGRSPS